MKRIVIIKKRWQLKGEWYVDAWAHGKMGAFTSCWLNRVVVWRRVRFNKNKDLMDYTNKWVEKPFVYKLVITAFLIFFNKLYRDSNLWVYKDKFLSSNTLSWKITSDATCYTVLEISPYKKIYTVEDICKMIKNL